MTCAACSKPGYKDWVGDDPKCAFPDGVFVESGWNCGTANAIRNHLDPWTEKRAPEVLVVDRYDDQCRALIRIPEESGVNADSLWVIWYKNRGRTEGMWLLSSDAAPRPPTEAECLAIAACLDRSAPQL